VNHLTTSGYMRPSGSWSERPEEKEKRQRGMDQSPRPRLLVRVGGVERRILFGDLALVLDAVKALLKSKASISL